MLSFRGTLAFAAPELKFGRIWNERVDIWAAGLCMYFMMQGILPFNIEDRKVAAQILKGNLPQVPFTGMSDVFINLIQQCLTVNSKDRPHAMLLLRHRFFGLRRISGHTQECAESFLPPERRRVRAYTDSVLHGINVRDQMSLRRDWMERRDGSNVMQRLANSHFLRTQELFSKSAEIQTSTKDNDEAKDNETFEPRSLKSLGRRHFFSRASSSLSEALFDET